MFAARAIERAGLDLNALREGQRKALDDLVRPFDEEAFAAISAYWTYDHRRLAERGGEQDPSLPAKPRIDVLVEITSKGNFKAEWFPTGANRFGVDSNDCDFVHFWRNESRGAGFDGRPSNELFFVRDVQTCLYSMHEKGQYRASAIDFVILAACAKLVERIKDRLSHQFELRMLADVFAEWRDNSPDDWSVEPEYEPVSWEIDDPLERRNRTELAFLDNLETELGFSEAALLDAKNGVESRPSRRGQEPSPHNFSDRIAKELKKSGLPATKGKVERALALIEKHRLNAKIIPFRR